MNKGAEMGDLIRAIRNQLGKSGDEAITFEDF